MNRTVLKIKVLYNDMGKSEKRVADWIMKNSTEILPLSITELAERSNSSEATIVRFSKRLGFSGYQELKLSIARDADNKVINENITGNDTCFEIFEKVCNDIYTSLEKTKKSLSEDAMSRAAESLEKAGKIVVFGLGNSASVATDCAHKLLRAGCLAYPYTDNHMQAIAASHVKNGDVAIGISHSGSSKDIVEALKIAKEHGGTALAITSRGKSPIVKSADITLFTDADETKYSILALNSRIAQLAIIDALYFHIAYKKDARSSIEETERALMSKKY